MNDVEAILGIRPEAGAPSPAAQKERKVRVLKETVNVYESPSAQSAVTMALKAGQFFFVGDRINADGRDWLTARDTSGHRGFIPGDAQLQDVVTQRFRIERVAFIAAASLCAGLIHSAVASQSDLPAIGTAAIVAFLLTGIYVTAKTFLGVGGFFEAASAEAIPAFDFKRFLREPLYALGLSTAVLLLVGAVVIFRKFIWPIMMGKAP